ncbi:MAG: hypothetical protein ACTSWC_05540 [Promethearchaeota archaeon]
MGEKKSQSDINFEDEIWDDVYNEIQQELSSNKIEDNNIKTHSDEERYCKICGQPISNLQIQKSCLHCGLPICRDCKSNYLCIYCFMNLIPFAQIALKLLKVLFFFSPFLFFASTVFFLDKKQIRTILLIILSITGGLYILLQLIVKFFPALFFSKKWEKTISSPQFKVITHDKRRIKFATDELLQDFRENRKRKINKLNNWINQTFSQYNAPIPLYIQEEKEKRPDIQQNTNNIRTLQIKFPKNEENSDEFEKKTEVKSLDLKFCPICSRKFDFGTFCISCNRKFCPKCYQEVDPYSKHCICGYDFPDLINQYNSEFSKK